MKLTVTQENSVTIITPEEKRLDAKVAVAFKETLLAEIEKGRVFIVVDLANVIFVDSSGLGALISGVRKVGVKGDIRLAGVNEQVFSMLQLTRLDKIFKLFDTRALAVESYLSP